MKKLYLTGFMGTGKSAVAEELSSITGIPFADMDTVLENDLEMPINKVFETKGEAFFRAAEKNLLTALSGNDNGLIISCGGGVVKDEENIRLMKESGKVVLLLATPETIYERLKDDDSRPLLKGKHSVSEIGAMIKERSALYEKAADIVVETDGSTPFDIAKRIIDDIDITML